MAQTLGQVTIGNIVKIKEDGADANYIVIQHGIPSGGNGIYPSEFADGTWLWRQRVTSETGQYTSSSGDVQYDESSLAAEMIAYENRFSSDIREAIITVRVPYLYGRDTIRSGNNGYSCKVFSLSAAELGGDNLAAEDYINFAPEREGTTVAYLAGLESQANKRAALLYGEYWTRSPALRASGSPTSAIAVDYYGDFDGMDPDYNRAARPCFLLPQNLMVDDNGYVLTNQPPSAPSSIAASNVIGNQNATVTLGAATDEDGTIANYIYERQVDGGSWTQFASTSSLSVTDSINDSWTTVTYRAKAVDNLGAEGPYATSQAYTVVHNQPPTAPGSINATNVVGGQNATITITAATDPDGTVESYVYERSVDDSSHWDVIATTSALSTTDTISSEWGTVAYRAKAVDDDGASGPYVTSEQYDVNVGWVLIGGPSTAMGQQIKPFTLSANIGVSGQTGVTGIAVTGYLDGKKVLDAALNQNDDAEIYVDTRILASGQHTIQMTAEKTDLLPANKAWQFAIPFNALPDGGRAEQLRDDQGNPIFPRTTAQQVISKNGLPMQNELDNIEKRFRGLTGHLEPVDAVFLGTAGAQTELPRESGVHYCFGVYSSAGGTDFTMVLVPAGINTAGTLDGNVGVTPSADKFTVVLNGSNAAIVQYFKFVVDAEAEVTTNPSALFTPLSQPHVFSASGGSTSSVTDQTEALQTIIAENANANYYVLEDTDGNKYYVAAGSVIRPSTESFTGPVYQDDQATTLYAGRTLVLVDTSNVAALFQPLAATVYDVTTQGTSVSAGSNLNETLLAMIEAQPTWHRYSIPGNDGETYYVLSEDTISTDATSAPDVYYCTDGSTYYTGGELSFFHVGDVGDIMTFAGIPWIVVHKTATEAYLCSQHLQDGLVKFQDIQLACGSWNSQYLTEDDRAILKQTNAGTTGGYVFVATEQQMKGLFEYFEVQGNRICDSTAYWTSTPSGDAGYFVSPTGYVTYLSANANAEYGFRPSICIDLTKL